MPRENPAIPRAIAPLEEERVKALGASVAVKSGKPEVQVPTASLRVLALLPLRVMTSVSSFYYSSKCCFLIYKRGMIKPQKAIMKIK